MNAVIDDFKIIEKNCGIFYANQFYGFLEEFLQLTKTKNFDSFFKKYHICTEVEIGSAMNEFIPDEFIPFFAEEQNGGVDYYCFERKNHENKNRVIVFSGDAVVREWKNSDEFLNWVSKKIN